MSTIRLGKQCENTILEPLIEKPRMTLLQKRRKTFLTTPKTNSAIQILGMLGLGLTLSTFQARAQTNIENNIGFHAAASVYQDFELNIPDHYYFGTNLEIGFDFTHYYDRSSFWKTGVNYTFFRSPYENDISYYDEYLRVPFFFSVSKLREFKHNNDLYLTLGPQVNTYQTRQDTPWARIL